MLEMVSRKIVYFSAVIVLLCSGCGLNNGVIPNKNDVLEVCMDQSGVLKEEVTSSNVEEIEEGYRVKIETADNELEYIVSKNGIVQSTVRKNKKTTDKAEESDQQKKDVSSSNDSESDSPILTKEQKKAKENALNNAGVIEEDCESIEVKENIDDTMTVLIKMKNGNTINTQTDKDGKLISSWNE